MSEQYLASLLNLFEEFNLSGLNYCHWKSNMNLGRSLMGLTDLDLLVEHSQVKLFKEIIFRHNVKSISSSRDHTFPAIENYLGMDEKTGKLFHLHVHYKLILGEQYVKNYHLPYESWLMEDSELSMGNVVIPSPEHEFIILVIRSLLKYRDRDVIKDILGIKTPGLPKEIRNELYYLFSLTTRDKVIESIDMESPIISAGLLNSYLEVFESDLRDGWILFGMRKQLRKEFQSFRRNSHWKASSEYFRKLLGSQKSDRDNLAGKKKLTAGGISIAIIGADGAGKSTLIREIKDWLSWKLAVSQFYMGSQEPSFLTEFCHFFARNAKRLVSLQMRVFGAKSFITRWMKSFAFSAENLYHIATAHDRFRRYQEGEKCAMGGGVVVYDRFPLQKIHELMQENPMDGPRIPDQLDSGNLVDDKLATIERKYYKRIAPPDIILALDVSPEISKERKPDHDFEIITRKSQVIRDFNKEGLRVAMIDADLPLETVLLNIKTVLWQNI